MENETPRILHKNELFTIVIPVRNRERLILRSLDSVYRQSYRPLRIIVVDNGSTDGTAAAVETWKAGHEDEDFHLDILHQERPGAAIARNTGLGAVDSRYMLFFDSDDVMATETVTTAMHEFARQPKLDLFFWRRAYVNEKDEVIPMRFSKRDPARAHCYNSVLSTQSYAVRTDFIRSCGGWNENLLCWDDWELGVRLLLANPVIKGTYRILAYVYPQKESITGVDFSSKAGVWEKALDAVEALAEGKDKDVSRNIRRMTAYRRVNLAALYTSEGNSDLGEKLLAGALESSVLDKRSRRLLKIIYEYTRRGGRGAYLIWR